MKRAGLVRITCRVALALAGALILVWLLGERGDRAPELAQPAAQHPSPTRPARRTLPSHPGAAANAVTMLMRDADVMEDELERYKDANRYDPRTIALFPGMDDALDPDRSPAVDKAVPSIRNLRASPEERLYYRLETDRYRYVAPDPIELRLSVFSGLTARVPVQVSVESASVARYSPSGERVDLGSVPLVEKSPGVYSARYTPPPAEAGAEDDLIVFDVAWAYTAGRRKRDADSVPVSYTSNPQASFTGKVREELRDGSLRLEVEVDSARAGEAQISGRLFARDASGREIPVTASIVTSDLQVGLTWVPLEFYGAVFRDRGLRGPYALRGVRGHFLSTKTAAGRGAEIAHGPEEYKTNVIDLSMFTDKEWDSPKKQIAIQALEEEIALLREERR